MKHSILNQLLRNRPIVVTGIGCVSSCGSGADPLWEGVLAARGLAREESFRIAGEKRVFPVCRAAVDDRELAKPRLVRKLDRCHQLAWKAASQALNQSGTVSSLDNSDTGLFVGTSRGPLDITRQTFNALSRRRYPPSLAASSTFASLGGVLAQGLHLGGPSGTISATCASGAVAIALAAEQILLGKCDRMLSGGSEAPLNDSVLAQLSAAGVLGTHSDPAQCCQPFDVSRNGLCLGEGSAFLLLEAEESALQRGVEPLARLSGWGMNVDDSGRAGVNETGSGLVRVGRDALAVAGLPVDAIDYINAHGTATRLNDLGEAKGVMELLGKRVLAVPCTSTKPVTGHCLGATPAMEAIICIQALRHQMVPPTANCHEQDPECPIQVQPLQPVSARLSHVMSNSLGFWGYHGSLIFSRIDL